MSGVGEGHLRLLHNHLMETGGYEFRAGGTGFFVVVGERYSATKGAAFAHMVVASREDDTINIDAIVAGGPQDPQAQFAVAMRATAVLRGFADRHGLILNDDI